VEQRYPHARFLPASEARYQQAHQQLENTLSTFCTRIESDDLGKLFIAVTALAHTFRSEMKLATAVAQQARCETKLPATAAIAGDKFTAAHAALQARPARAIPAGKQAAFLAALPLTALPEPPPEMLRRLHLFGISTLGEFAQLSHEAVVRQFGPDLAHFHNLARGRDTRPLQPYVPPPVITCTRTLPEPLAELQALQNELRQLVIQLAQGLESAGYHVTALALAATDESGRAHHREGGLKPPTAARARLHNLGARLLSQLTPPTPIIALQLTAYPLRQWQHGARQMNLFQQRSARTAMQRQQALRSLRQRFGDNVVQMASAIDPPEPTPVQVRCAPSGEPEEMRLHKRSYPVECVLQHWRMQLHWWEKPARRDYFQVSVAGERILTLFRDGEGLWFLDHAIY
jgi:nucleotidyltransferase/DNA polymerase involved in DNA repair